MLRNDLGYIQTIIRHGQVAVKTTQGSTFDHFNSRPENEYIVGFAIVQIAECCKKISTEFQSKYPEIPWKEIVGMRNILVHAYDSADSQIVWEAAANHLPPLISSLEVILEIELGTS